MYLGALKGEGWRVVKLRPYEHEGWMEAFTVEEEL